jgi:hypothetical protein
MVIAHCHIIAIAIAVPSPSPFPRHHHRQHHANVNATPLAFVAPLKSKSRNDIPLTIRREPIILTGSKDTNLLLGELDAADYA